MEVLDSLEEVVVALRIPSEGLVVVLSFESGSLCGCKRLMDWRYLDPLFCSTSSISEKIADEHDLIQIGKTESPSLIGLMVPFCCDGT